jgi:hypothetical protein
MAVYAGHLGARERRRNGDQLAESVRGGERLGHVDDAAAAQGDESVALYGRSQLGRDDVDEPGWGTWTTVAARSWTGGAEAAARVVVSRA